MLAGLSILIPVYNRSVKVLVESLLRQAPGWLGGFEIVLLDDNSDAGFQLQNRLLAQLPSVRYEELPANVGRAAIRNRLAARARQQWLLLLDNDSLLPAGAPFLARYAQAVQDQRGAGLFIGGTTYEATPPADPALQLRWLYGRAREMRPAAVRQRDPGGQLTINNALIKRQLLHRFPLDERLSGYGHEDTRFGLALAQAGVVVQHLDNPVLHDGLEPATVFLEKSRQAVHNLAQVLRIDALGADTRLAGAARRLRQLGLARAALAVLAKLEPALRRNLLSPRPDLRALDALKLRWLLQELD
ncbi:glycosyltransferase family 2 protein [Hymenobacter sp. BRD67]|uniref:glycosyltransferase family 2 protein n=1 Tax=Hymenobacter sp. BRD67 TaxID=2675877 RepID=UPI0015679578|nr:glycosyltransferase [Hymenobacter sp. BRD67]QKG52788.1 glycosyltransferase [Hymenobacter sp. BRD67]